MHGPTQTCILCVCVCVCVCVCLCFLCFLVCVFLLCVCVFLCVCFFVCVFVDNATGIREPISNVCGLESSMKQRGRNKPKGAIKSAKKKKWRRIEPQSGQKTQN